jgi:hypothetical protein
MMGTVDESHHQNEPVTACSCFTYPSGDLVVFRELGMDERFAEVSLLACPCCNQFWLRYLYEVEAFTASGRWYLGPVAPEQASGLAVGDAKSTLEGLEWYFFGGSYYRGRGGKASGPLLLNP